MPKSVVARLLFGFFLPYRFSLLARTADNSTVECYFPPKQKHAVQACSCFGGDKRIRTAGLLVANETLYQLSHIPVQDGFIKPSFLCYLFKNSFITSKSSSVIACSKRQAFSSATSSFAPIFIRTFVMILWRS